MAPLEGKQDKAWRLAPPRHPLLPAVRTVEGHTGKGSRAEEKRHFEVTISSGPTVPTIINDVFQQIWRFL